MEKGLLPFVDIAYQGFGEGLEEDAFGLRLLANKYPEMVIAASCSKNFGFYRERVGWLLSVKTVQPVKSPITNTERCSCDLLNATVLWWCIS